mmetsp:Transcript_11250/g.18853  ORF Transcript_11250/g.18853 Transcript_11250/m.18853 type:complete len:445 (+) Transcript_11250:386-1720(+)
MSDIAAHVNKMQQIEEEKQKLQQLLKVVDNAKDAIQSLDDGNSTNKDRRVLMDGEIAEWMALPATNKKQSVNEVMIDVRIVMLNDAVLRLRKVKDIIPQSSRSKFGFGSSKRESRALNSWRVTHALPIKSCQIKNISQGEGIRRFVLELKCNTAASYRLATQANDSTKSNLSQPIFELAMVHQHVFEMWLATLSERMGAEIDRKQLKKSCSTLRVSALQDINRATLRGQNHVPQSLRKSSVVTIRADASKLRPSLHITPAPKQQHTKASRSKHRHDRPARRATTSVIKSSSSPSSRRRKKEKASDLPKRAASSILRQSTDEPPPPPPLSPSPVSSSPARFPVVPALPSEPPTARVKPPEEPLSPGRPTVPMSLSNEGAPKIPASHNDKPPLPKGLSFGQPPPVPLSFSSATTPPPVPLSPRAALVAPPPVPEEPEAPPPPPFGY